MVKWWWGGLLAGGTVRVRIGGAHDARVGIGVSSWGQSSLYLPKHTVKLIGCIQYGSCIKNDVLGAVVPIDWTRCLARTLQIEND